jgi:hypothetical protein
MRLDCILSAILAFACVAFATILENGRPRPTDYPDTKIDPKAYNWKTYQADAHELSLRADGIASIFLGGRKSRIECRGQLSLQD